MFIFCLKNTYKEINKLPIEEKSLESKINKLESKKEKLIDKFPRVSNFLSLENIFDVEYTKKFFQFKRKTDLDDEINLIFNVFLPSYNKGHSSEELEIKEEKGNNYISYKYTINNVKDPKNNGLCMEAKLYFERKKFGNNQPISSIARVDISLSKGETVIARITREI